MIPIPTATTELPMAILRLLNASSMKLIGLLVGWAITFLKASSDAPGGMRVRPSGRDRFRGSSDMLKIQTMGKSTASSSAARQAARLEGTLVVTNKTPGTATILDAGSGRILATLPTGAGPHEVALSADGRVAVVTDYGGPGGGSTLTVIDVPGLRVARTIDLGEYRSPHGIAFLPGDLGLLIAEDAYGCPFETTACTRVAPLRVADMGDRIAALHQ